MTREEIVHAGAPVVLASDSTPISPVAVDQHAKRVSFAECVVQCASLKDLLE